MEVDSNIDAFFEGPRGKRFCWQIVVVCGLLAAIEAMDIYVLGVIVKPLAQDLDVSLATFSFVFTFQALGQIAGTYFLAPLADKVGRRPVILYCTLGFGILTITAALSTSLSVFIAQRLAAFVLLGGAVPNMFAIASEFGSKKSRHRNTLIIGSFHGIGAGLAFIIGGLLLDYGWQAPLVFTGTLTLLSFVLAYFYMPESIRYSMTKSKHINELDKLLKKIDPEADHSSLMADISASLNNAENKIKIGVSSLLKGDQRTITLLLWVMGALTISLIGAVAQWTPTYLHTYGGVDLKQAAFMASVSGPAGIIWPIVLIWLMNRLGPARAMALNYFFAACALSAIALISVFPNVGWLIAFGYGAFLGGATSGFYTLCALAYRTEIRATGISWAVGAGRVFSLFVPVLGGIAVANEVKPQIIAAVLASALLLVMVTTLVLGEALAQRDKAQANY